MRRFRAANLRKQGGTRRVRWEPLGTEGFRLPPYYFGSPGQIFLGKPRKTEESPKAGGRPSRSNRTHGTRQNRKTLGKRPKISPGEPN